MRVKILRTVKLYGHLESMPTNLATLPLKLFGQFSILTRQFNCENTTPIQLWIKNPFLKLSIKEASNIIYCKI